MSYIRSSGGIFLDMTIHDFDMARFLVADEVESVYSAGAVRIDPEIGNDGDLDTVLIVMQFKSGIIGTIDNSRRAVYGYDQRVEVFGSAGMVAAGNRPTDVHVLSNRDGIHSAKPIHFFLERYQEAYLIEMQEFAACIREDRPPSVTGIDGLQPVVTALAAIKALREHRFVRISEIARSA